MTASMLAVDDKTLIPDLLRMAPQARTVLDRYGLRGCGGPEGPREGLQFFSRAHDVPLEQLLRELHESTSAAIILSAGPSTASSLADGIYRPFFVAGIATVLTLGAVWGAYLLLQIGMSGRFSAAGLHAINAHGHAQIFGWVGLFVMGFAYQAFPRFKHTTLAYPALAMATLIMMVAGLTARAVTQPLVETWPWLWWAAVGGSLLEIAAALVFTALIALTWRRSGKPLAAYDYYIAASLVWFVVQAIYEGVYLTATLAVTGEALTQLVSTWQAPLRDVQIHGFALLIVLGVSQRIFHHFYSLPLPSSRLSLALLPIINVAVLGEAAGLVLMRLYSPVWAALWYASVVVLTICVAALVANWRLWRRAEEPDRSLKFLRVAYVWLFISLAMLVLLPLYQAVVLQQLAPDSAAAQMGFSHAYYGAARHAITVGFISLMIVGVAAKVVPTLNGVSTQELSALWGPFVLINTGCTLRVVGQTLTDFHPLAFPVAGMSGILEVMGLALWGAHLVLIMCGRARLRRSASEPFSLANREICLTDTVGAVLEAYPNLLGTFLAYGFTPLTNPSARRTIAGAVTVRRACGYVGVDPNEFIKRLNAERARLAAMELPLIETTSGPNCVH